MKKLLLILILGVSLASCDYQLVSSKDIQKACEKAYFEGQREALKGDIRIELNSDSTYVWSKSPWNDGTEPIFHPTHDMTKNGINRNNNN